jgi:peptidoglycan/LPS O-acetylase OafA/YrhL
MNNSGLALAPADWAAKEGRVPSLDGLRMFSVSLVLLGHRVLPESLLGVSAFGVKVFFFISGFLITRLLFAEWKRVGRVSLPDFYLRRLFRLYPVLILFVAVTVAFAGLMGWPIAGVDIASVFFYFVNYLVSANDLAGREMTLPYGMLWTLSVEEHFYLFAPLLFVLVRATPMRMLGIAATVCIVSLGLRLLYAGLWPEYIEQLVIYHLSETRVDSIAYGVIFACLCETSGGRRLIGMLTTRWALLVGILVMLASFAIRDDYFQNTWRFSMQGLALFPIIAGTVFAAPIPLANYLLNLPFVAWIGKLSYSLYVWHGGTLFLFGALVSQVPDPWKGPFELAITFVLAVASYYVVEQPALRLGRKFIKRRHAPVEPTLSVKPQL